MSYDMKAATGPEPRPLSNNTIHFDTLTRVKSVDASHVKVPPRRHVACDMWDWHDWPQGTETQMDRLKDGSLVPLTLNGPKDQAGKQQCELFSYFCFFVLFFQIKPWQPIKTTSSTAVAARGIWQWSQVWFFFFFLLLFVCFSNLSLLIIASFIYFSVFTSFSPNYRNSNSSSKRSFSSFPRRWTPSGFD